jgi:hypothetical protein
MAGSFFDSFNTALVDLEASFSEDWILNGVTYPAIAINDLADMTIQMKGGGYDTSEVTIFVRLEIFTQSGVKEGDIVTARGKELAVHTIGSQGDACRELTCGPAQIDVFSR